MSLSFLCDGNELRVSHFCYVIYAKGGGKNYFFLRNDDGKFDRSFHPLYLRAIFSPDERPEISIWRYGKRHREWKQQMLLSYDQDGTTLLHPVLSQDGVVIAYDRGEIVCHIHQNMFTAKHVWDNKYEMDMQFKFQMSYSGIVVETQPFPVPQFRPVPGEGKKRACGSVLESPPDIEDPLPMWEQPFNSVPEDLPDSSMDPTFQAFIEEDEVLRTIEDHQKMDPFRVVLNDYVGHMYDSLPLVDQFNSMCMVRDGGSYAVDLSCALHILGPSTPSTLSLLGTVHTHQGSSIPTFVISDNVLKCLYLNLSFVQTGQLIIYDWPAHDGVLAPQQNVLWSQELTKPSAVAVVCHYPPLMSPASLLVELKDFVQGSVQAKVMKLKDLHEWTLSDLVQWMYLFALANNAFLDLCGPIGEFAQQAPSNAVAMLASNDESLLSFFPPSSVPPFLFHAMSSEFAS